MEINNNKCATCAHNLDKTGLDCEFHCVQATGTRTASDGTVYITSCGDYLKDSATYSVTYEDDYTDGRKEKRTCNIQATGNGLAMTLQKIGLFGLKLIGITKV